MVRPMEVQCLMLAIFLPGEASFIAPHGYPLTFLVEEFIMICSTGHIT